MDTAEEKITNLNIYKLKFSGHVQCVHFFLSKKILFHHQRHQMKEKLCYYSLKVPLIRTSGFSIKSVYT